MTCEHDWDGLGNCVKCGAKIGADKPEATETA